MAGRVGSIELLGIRFAARPSESGGLSQSLEHGPTCIRACVKHPWSRVGHLENRRACCDVGNQGPCALGFAANEDDDGESGKKREQARKVGLSRLDVRGCSRADLAARTDVPGDDVPRYRIFPWEARALVQLEEVACGGIRIVAGDKAGLDRLGAG